MASVQDMTINDTGFLQITTGRTATRNQSPVTGEVMYNTDYESIEVYDGAKWVTANRRFRPSGRTSNGAFDDLDQINDEFSSGTVTLQTTLGKQFGNSTQSVPVNFTGGKAYYQTTATTGTSVASGGIVGGNCISTSGGVNGCSEGTDVANYSLYAAMKACILAGFRLCTRDEILAGAARGSGCGHDANAIWTSDHDALGRYYTIHGSTASYGTGTSLAYPDDPVGASAGFADARIGIRCCAPTSGNGPNNWDIR